MLIRLLSAGANPGTGLVDSELGGHPIVQLANRDLDGSVIEPLYEALLLRAGYDDSAPVLRDGRGLLEYVRDASFPHQRSRERLLERLQEIASAAVE